MSQAIGLKTLKQFGGSASAGAGGISVFGSLTAGSPAYSLNPATIQSLSAWVNAWSSAVIAGNNDPALEDMNAVLFVLSYMLMYWQQEGWREWDAGTPYNYGSIVKTPYTGSGAISVFMSLSDTNTNQALPTAPATRTWPTRPTPTWSWSPCRRSTSMPPSSTPTGPTQPVTVRS